MAKTIIGIFQERTNAESAINELREKGFDAKNFSIVMKDTREAEELSDNTGADVTAGAVSGATTGAIIGGLAGLLASFVIPGLGAFFIGGPIAAALGLTGAAASTVSGAATGALAGGLLGALTGLGLSEQEAQEYEEQIRAGAILLAVPAKDTEETEVRSALDRNHATSVKVVTTPMDKMESRSTTATHADREYSESPRGYSDPMAYSATKGGRSQVSTSRGKKGGSRSSSRESEGRGWHGDSEGHAKAAQGKKVKS